MKICRLIATCAILIGLNISASANTTDDEGLYLRALYQMINPADSADRSAEFYLDYAIRPALEAREEMPWGSTVSERDFLHFVLPLRVNNESIDRHRPAIYNELKDRVKDLSMHDAVLEINHWCHEKATYQPSDARTHSPLQTISSAIGRCGEESTFTVAALRAMGIPARQVYTPRWAHTDDNHAWVEAWADGRWYFLGACEPEPVLNLGWFNAPAARGMLMHARVPGANYDGPEEVLGRMVGNTDINVTSIYAPVDTVTVKIVNKNEVPVAGADVTFRIYNYAEFYPIASKLTDSHGEASLICGLGDLMVWATDGVNFGFKKCHVGTDRFVTVPLTFDGSTQLSADFDLVPPVARDAEVVVPDQLRAANDLRLAHEDSIRSCYVATFPTRPAIDSIAVSLNIPPERLTPLVVKSRGNHRTIIKFLSEKEGEELGRAIALLESVTEKDLTDITPEVLDDHFRASIAPGYCNELFARYVMSPRIDNEELTPFRSELRDRIDAEMAETFIANPAEWVKFVSDSINADLVWYPESATMSPLAVWNLRHTSPKSRDIFFVAGARSLGIPAMIDPVNGRTLWADKESTWHVAEFGHANDHSDNVTKSSLQLLFTPTRAVDDPKYYSHFTISKIVDGIPQLQTYHDFAPLSETFAHPMEIETGQYMIVTGQRLADGSVMSHIDLIQISDKPTVGTLTLRQDTTAVEVLGSFDSESLFRQAGHNDLQSLLSATGRGYYALALLSPAHEPSNHALRDIAAEKEIIEQWGRPLILLWDDESSLRRAEIPEDVSLPSTTLYGSDIDGSIAKSICESLKISPDQYPILIIADTFNRVVFVSNGYTIGLGRQIADTIRRL
ncbi:MAG: transglutaminase domain-containing protein [Bacteroides sp.]|nr:transglutaminase domain-containing protein [Bacteroides sp.]MCM1413415.1 transglutaminase domain-containing protein [Bacteroides sp.]MCM1471374.1 transglutaminase domain-containing protein [Bacteroides sp.]